MDMFMDKLAQKLTAQEIIKANTAADIEELNRLKNQIAEYNECLSRLQKLIDDGAAKLADARAHSDETDGRILGSLARLQSRLEEISSLVRTETTENQTRAKETGDLIREELSVLQSRLEEISSLVRAETTENQARTKETSDLIREELSVLQSRLEEISSLVRAETTENQTRAKETGDLIREELSGLRSYMEEAENLTRAQVHAAQTRMEEADSLAMEGMDGLRSCLEEMNSLVRAQAAESQARTEETRSLIREGMSGIQSHMAKMNAQAGEAAEAARIYSEKNDQIQAGMDRLRSRIEEASSLVRAEGDGSQARHQESLEELQTLRHDVEILRQIQGKMVEKFDSMDKSVAWQLEFMTKSMGEKLEQLGAQEEEEASGQLGERLDAMEESVHRECVKVYRNVQAVVTEEGGKQDNAITEMKSSMADLKGRLGAVLAFSVLAMVLSLAGIAFQVLGWLNIL